ncbi:EamA family transporter RarD [Croceicoccus pelagius]|uniref:Transporter n=1 Tax=Croceicoccus pelagius TaxID=1703341 RepID=A0A916YHP9_9SPHN|nr:EamA family transporter RarD [Croceicoccus pelagius]GGD45144.1 transporter [Croceicoccus pelagius]
MTTDTDSQTKRGLPYALGAYTLWGLLPLYLVWLNPVDPFRLVAWRVLWTIPICFAALALFRNFAKLKAAFSNRRAIGLLLLSALLITVNWVAYIIAVQAGQFYAASLGYYINPLVNVLLGTLFLGEKLSKLQWLAVAVASMGIGILVFEAADTLYISLTLAFSFGLYGLVRKQVKVDALPGLTVEVLLVAPLALVALAVVPEGAEDFGTSVSMSLLLMGAGVMTGVPLLLFATAARRMAYSALGFVQFLAPTMVFLSGLLIFGQELVTAQAICFALIWTAVALFCADIVMKGRRRRLPPDPV